MSSHAGCTHPYAACKDEAAQATLRTSLGLTPHCYWEMAQ